MYVVKIHRGVSGLLMVLVGHESTMVIDRDMGEGWSERVAILIISIFLWHYYLQYTNFLSLIDK